MAKTANRLPNRIILGPISLPKPMVAISDVSNPVAPTTIKPNNK